LGINQTFDRGIEGAIAAANDYQVNLIPVATD
jgi:hypothetical protein